MVVDRDIDAVMHRTRHRPLVTGAVTPRAAAIFAVLLEAAAFVLLWRAVNLFSALLALGCRAVLRLRLLDRPQATLDAEHRHRRSRRCRAGARRLDGGHRSPRLAGGGAVRDDRDLDAVALLGAGVALPGGLQGRQRADASGGGPFDRVSRQIIVYSVALVACSFVFGVVDHSGWIYWAAAGLAGALYLADAVRLRREEGTPKSAMRLFTYSITYVTVDLRGDGGRRARPLPLSRSAHHWPDLAAVTPT